MGIGQQWATQENDPFDGEKSLHIQGTRDRGDKLDFWLYNPPHRQAKGSIVCGICKRPMEGKHCLNCYPRKEV